MCYTLGMLLVEGLAAYWGEESSSEVGLVAVPLRTIVVAAWLLVLVGSGSCPA